MKCLNCEKEFEAKRDSAKYCSANCRVKAHQKRGIKERKENVVQMQVIMNTVLEVLGKMSDLPKDYQSITNIGIIKSNGEVEPMFPAKPKIRRSFDNYQQLKLDCESVEVWNELKAEILASDLSSKQKVLLTS